MMKILFISLIALAVLLPRDAEGQGGPGSDCPQICPALWGPICAQSPDGTKQTFANECELKARNCQNRTNFQKVSQGTCETGGL